MELSTHGPQDASVGILIKRLVSSSRVTEERAVAKELLQLLDTPAFRAALSDFRSEEGQGGSNGWTETLKAVVIKVNSAHATAEADFVQALSRLVEEADRCGALFDGENVDKVVKSILQNERIAHAPTPQIKKLYWSILSSLASEAAYFRAVGRETAQERCGQLASFAWEALLPGAADDSGTSGEPSATVAARRGSYRASAARLLTRLLLHFPYALPEDQLQELLKKLLSLAKACTPAAAAPASAAAR